MIPFSTLTAGMTYSTHHCKYSNLTAPHTTQLCILYSRHIKIYSVYNMYTFYICASLVPLCTFFFNLKVLYL